MKQTAVEWLVEEMFKQGYLNDKPLTIKNIESFVKQAKEMEKNYYICIKCKSKLDEKDMQQMQNKESI
jgi:hypothetical protein